MQILHSPTFWVAVSFFLFIAAIFRPVGRIILRGLDGRAEKIASELNEARRLREEAERIHGEYKQRQAEVARETQAILEQTRKDAAQIADQASQELKATLEKRTRAAMEKIAQAEAKAVEDVQHHMADIAIAAARAIMRDYLAKGGQDEMLKAASTEIGRKLH